MKVVSYSVWGSNPKYALGAIRNAEAMPLYYPGWRGRFYCGSSVPADIVARLQAFEHVDVIQMEEPGDWTSMFWRFLPASDEDVSVMISRDTDSRLSRREAAAVQQWLEGDKDFHVMRDHPLHRTAIMGGMWGVRNHLLRPMKDLIAAYLMDDRWQVDQEFLTTRIAPLVREHWLEHDEYFHGRSFPTRRVGGEFIGQAFDGNDQPLGERPSRLQWRTLSAKNWMRYQLNATAGVARRIFSSGL